MLNPSSPFLSERLISRLSPLRRSNLERRIREHHEDLKERLPYCESTELAPGITELALFAEYARALDRMLGRLAALTA